MIKIKEGLTRLEEWEILFIKDEEIDNAKTTGKSVREGVETLKKVVKQTKTPFAMSVEGDWGSGKTTLVKTVLRELDEKDYTPIEIDAWKKSQLGGEKHIAEMVMKEIKEQLLAKKGGQVSKIVILAIAIVAILVISIWRFILLNGNSVAEMNQVSGRIYVDVYSMPIVGLSWERATQATSFPTILVSVFLRMLAASLLSSPVPLLVNRVCRCYRNKKIRKKSKPKKAWSLDFYSAKLEMIIAGFLAKLEMIIAVIMALCLFCVSFKIGEEHLGTYAEWLYILTPVTILLTLGVTNFDSVSKFTKSTVSIYFRNIATLEKQIANILERHYRHSDKVVIFVDNLDRIQPYYALEVVEVINNFLRIEKVFCIMTIDSKLLSNAVDEKLSFRQERDKIEFLNKIFQLSYKMPVSEYEISELLESMLGQTYGLSVVKGNLDSSLSFLDLFLGEKDAIYLNEVEQLLEKSVGKNPRDIKLIVNRYLLAISELEPEGKGVSKEELKNLGVQLATVSSELLLILFSNITLQWFSEFYNLLLNVQNYGYKIDLVYLETFASEKAVNNLFVNHEKEKLEVQVAAKIANFMSIYTAVLRKVGERLGREYVEGQIEAIWARDHTAYMEHSAPGSAPEAYLLKPDQMFKYKGRIYRQLRNNLDALSVHLIYDLRKH